MTGIIPQIINQAPPRGATVPGPKTYHLTTEYILAAEAGSHEDYCRMQCGLCRAFVARLKAPIEFDALKVFFPFMRVASVLEFPRTQNNMATWLHLAFHAGLDLGRAHPEVTEDILPDHVLRNAQRSLATLEEMVGDNVPGLEELRAAFARLAEHQWPRINPAEMDHVYCEAALRALRAGFLATTLGVHDPCLADFCAALPTEPGDGQDLIHLTLIRACVYEWNLALVTRMEHPLLRCARQMHPNDSAAQERLLTSLGTALRAAAVCSENEDPAALLQHGTDGGDCKSDGLGEFRGRLLERMIRRLNCQTADPAVEPTADDCRRKAV